MEKFKEALIKFVHSNPSLFPNDATNTYSRLIEQRFSQLFPDLQIPNHPPYAAMIHKAIWELKEKEGSSEESISEHIKREYVDLPWAHSTLLKHHLEKLCDRKEICMTHKQSYLLGGADSDPISSSRSEKQLKRKQNSESGKKSSRHRKKQKSRPDSESGKTSNRKQKKYKKKKERQLDLQETNKQIVEVVQEKVFQEQDLVLQPLDEVADEQENIVHNGLIVEVVQEKVFQEQDLVLQPLDEVADEQENIVHNGLIVEVVQEKVFQEQDLVLQPLDEVADEQENIVHNGLIVEVVQEQDLVLQPLDEVADEQENIIHNGLCEPQYLEIENGTFEQGTSLINIPVQETEEGGVPANPVGQNESEIAKDNLGEKVSMSTHFDDTGNETQSVELANDKDQIDINGTKKGKLKRKKRLKSQTRNNKRGKKHKINEDTQLQTLSETTLKQHNNITEGDSDEQNQMIEVNMTEIPIKYENVAEDVEKDGETTQESQPDNSGYISCGQIQMEQNPQLQQLEKSPDSNPILLKSKHPGKRFLTRSQIKTISKKDASIRPELMESPSYANVPNDEHSSEEKQQVIETKQVSSAVSTRMNGQRAKLRSSQKNTGHLETQQKSRSPSLEKPLKELLNLKCTKLSPQFSDLDEPATEVQEPCSSQQDQQPDELEAKPKYKGRGRRPKYKGRGRNPAAISKKGPQSAEKCKVLVKHSHVKKGQQKYQGQQTNEEEEAKNNGHGRHKMMRRSSRKEKDPNS